MDPGTDLSSQDPILSNNNDKKRRRRKLKKLAVKRVPILGWITKYRKEDIIPDFIAGLTLGMTLIPQSIAYANLAGLPAHYGLYSSFLGKLLYVVFGTVREVSIGPTSLMSLLTLQYTMDKPVEFVILLTFVVGVVELLMGILKVGFVVDFISVPVTSAFTSAASLIIISSQLKSLVGIKYKSTNFYTSVYKFFEQIQEVQMGDLIVSVCCVIFLLVFRKLEKLPVPLKDKRAASFIKKILWYVTLSRNALVVFILAIVAANWPESSEIPFELSGEVKAGISSFQWPPFTVAYEGETWSFWDMCSELGIGIIMIPLVSVSANIAIAKSFSNGKVVDATQEMLALGLCNVFGSFFQSMPTCGAFTRAAVSQASGIRTTLSGVYTGIIILLALSLLTPYFKFIPSATLAAVLICAVAFMIDFKTPIELWKKSKRDFFSWTVTMIACLLIGVEYGLLVGIAICALYLLILWARPKTEVATRTFEGKKYVYIKPNMGLYFSGVDNLRSVVTKASFKHPQEKDAVIDCASFTGIDFTSVQGLNHIAADLQRNNVKLILLNVEKDLQKHFDAKNLKLVLCNREEDLKEALNERDNRNGHTMSI